MKPKLKLLFISFFTALTLFGFMPFAVSAQNQTTPPAQPIPQGSGGFQAEPTTSGDIVNPTSGGLVNCGKGTTQSDSCTLYDLFSLFARVINFLMAVAAFFAIFQIVRAGQAMILAFGNPESLTTAKASLTNAVLGFALVMIAYLLLYFVVYQFLGVKFPDTNLFFHPIDYLTKIQ